VETLREVGKRRMG